MWCNKWQHGLDHVVFTYIVIIWDARWSTLLYILRLHTSHFEFLCRYLIIYRSDKLVICPHSRFCIVVLSKNYYLYLATFKHLEHLQSTIKFDNFTSFTCFQYLGTNSYFVILPLEDPKHLSRSKNSKHLWIEQLYGLIVPVITFHAHSTNEVWIVVSHPPKLMP